MEVRLVFGLVLATLLVINAEVDVYDRAGKQMETMSRERLVSVAEAIAAEVERGIVRPRDEH
jgi:hypothetical protein